MGTVVFWWHRQMVGELLPWSQGPHRVVPRKPLASPHELSTCRVPLHLLPVYTLRYEGQWLHCQIPQIKLSDAQLALESR